MAPLDRPYLQTMLDDLDTFIKEAPDAEKSVIAFELHNPTATMRTSQSETAFSDRGRHGTMFSIATWSKEENDDRCKDWGQKFDARMMEDFRRRQAEEAVDEMTRTSTGRYPNYDCEHK